MVWGVPRALLQTHFIMCSPALHFIHDHLQGVLACLSIDLPCFDLTSCPASAPSARVAHPTHPHHHSQHRGATHVNIHIFMFKRCPARGGSLYGLNFSRNWLRLQKMNIHFLRLQKMNIHFCSKVNIH